MATILSRSQPQNDEAEKARQAAEQAERQRQQQAQTQAMSQKLGLFGSERKAGGTWVEELQARCRNKGYAAYYQDTSDRRGGRTAWSSIVTVGGTSFPAKYWYDGSYIKNAREDAAAVACGVAH